MPKPGKPTRRMLAHSGTLKKEMPVMSGIVTSAAPSPIAKHPIAPAKQLWESEPMTSMPD